MKGIIHYLKIEAKYAKRIIIGMKTFEVRLNDRDYQVNDVIKYEIINYEKHDDKHMQTVISDYSITYIHRGLGMNEEFGDYVILGIRPIDVEYKGLKEVN